MTDRKDPKGAEAAPSRARSEPPAKDKAPSRPEDALQNQATIDEFDEEGLGVAPKE